MKVYKLEVIVIDHEDIGDEIIEIIENQKYRSIISPKVVAIQSADIEWSDDHPLNKSGFETELKQLFEKSDVDSVMPNLEDLEDPIQKWLQKGFSQKEAEALAIASKWISSYDI